MTDQQLTDLIHSEITSALQEANSLSTVDKLTDIAKESIPDWLTEGFKQECGDWIKDTVKLSIAWVLIHLSINLFFIFTALAVLIVVEGSYTLWQKLFKDC